MKVDGKSVAKAYVAKHSKQPELRDEGKVVKKDVSNMEAHFDSIRAFIDAVHDKNAPAAHEHMTKFISHYSKPNAEQEQPK